MHPCLKDLHQDHINLGKVLRLLEQQLNLIRTGEDLDLYVLSDVVDYVQSYPDLIHHPREDVIFMVYRERSNRGLDLIERLLQEHRLLIASTVELSECLEQWRQDSPLLREEIVSRVGDYLRLQWDHLNLEEGQVYELLDSGLNESDWQRIEAAMPRGTDPLFGDLMRKRYENIFDHVLTLSE